MRGKGRTNPGGFAVWLCSLVKLMSQRPCLNTQQREWQRKKLVINFQLPHSHAHIYVGVQNTKTFKIKAKQEKTLCSNLLMHLGSMPSCKPLRNLAGQSLNWCWSDPPSSQHLSHTRTTLYILHPRQQLTSAANIPVTARTILCSSIAQAACDIRTTPLESSSILIPKLFWCCTLLSHWLFLSVFFGAPFLTGRVPKTQSLAPFSIYTFPPYGIYHLVLMTFIISQIMPSDLPLSAEKLTSLSAISDMSTD